MTPHNLQCYADGDIADMDIGSLTYDEFATMFLSVQNKQAEIVPFVRNRLQRHFYAARQASDKDKHLIIKSRQQGVSTDIQGEQRYKAVTSTILGAAMADTQDNTDHLRGIAAIFNDSILSELDIKIGIDNASTVTYLPSQSKIRIGTAGGKHKGRGGTYTFFHGSEVAFWKDTESTISGALQGLAPGGMCIFETTANGAQGWVWDVYNNPGDWHIHFYAWWWTDEYQIELSPDEIIEYTEDELKCIELARADGFELTPEQIKWRRSKQSQKGLLFEQEYPETLEGAFIKSGKSVFAGYEKALYKLTDDYEPDPTHIYVAGIDWGQSDDYTGISVCDVTDGKEVYLDRFNKEDWGVMIDKLVSVCVKFRTKLVQPEYNSMSMQVNEFEEKIVAEYTKYNEERDKDIPEWYCTIEAYTMTNKRKDDLVSNFYTAIKYNGYQLLDIEYANSEMATFVTTQSKTGAYIYGAIPGGHDDTVIMRMLALNAAQGMNY